MLLMISQPMNGKSNEEIKEERKNIVKEFTEKGYTILDAIVSEHPPQGSDEALYYLSKSIEFMSKVDGVVFMPGWDEARGCIIENYIAIAYGKFIKYYTVR